MKQSVTKAVDCFVRVWANQNHVTNVDLLQCYGASVLDLHNRICRKAERCRWRSLVWWVLRRAPPGDVRGFLGFVSQGSSMI